MRAGVRLAVGVRTMTDESTTTPRSDDGEIRGEHDYTSQRNDATAPTTEQILRQRKEGQYAAGADGTQAVSGHRVPAEKADD
jgi:hypothetical protein